MDFCILKFVKLLITLPPRPPKLLLAHLSPTVDMDRRPLLQAARGPRVWGPCLNKSTIFDVVIYSEYVRAVSYTSNAVLILKELNRFSPITPLNNMATRHGVWKRHISSDVMSSTLPWYGYIILSSGGEAINVWRLPLILAHGDTPSLKLLTTVRLLSFYRPTSTVHRCDILRIYSLHLQVSIR